jgi:hypothetical protein
MYVYVGGTNPPTSFTVSTLTGMRDSAGHPVVRALVHNTGGLGFVTILAGAILIAILAALITLIITHRRRRLS